MAQKIPVRGVGQIVQSDGVDLLDRVGPEGMDAGSRRKTPSLPKSNCRSQQAAPDLIFFDGFEQGFEIALAKAVIALALDEFEEDRPDQGFRKDLKQDARFAAADHAFAVDQGMASCRAWRIGSNAGSRKSAT